jgi:hypothetical protein
VSHRHADQRPTGKLYGGSLRHADGNCDEYADQHADGNRYLHCNSNADSNCGMYTEL